VEVSSGVRPQAGELELLSRTLTVADTVDADAHDRIDPAPLLAPPAMSVPIDIVPGCSVELWPKCSVRQDDLAGIFENALQIPKQRCERNQLSCSQ